MRPFRRNHPAHPTFEDLRRRERRFYAVMLVAIVVGLLQIAFAAGALGATLLDPAGATSVPVPTSTTTTAPGPDETARLAETALWHATSTTTAPPRPRPPRYALGADEQLDCIGRWESERGEPKGEGYDDVSDSGTYGGRYQFDQPTWDEAVTGAGYPEWAGKPPHEAPAHVQDAAARWQIHADGGVKDYRWPTPARKGC